MAGLRGTFGRISGPTRAFAKKTSRKQRAVGAGAVALALTAPFGGLSPVKAADPAELQLKQTYDVGIVEITVTDVGSVDTLAPGFIPDVDGDRAFVVAAKVKNTGRLPIYSVELSQAIEADGQGVRMQDDRQPRFQLVSRTDGVRVSTINPGVTADLYLVQPQLPQWRPQQVTLRLRNNTFRELDSFGFGVNVWSPAEVTAEGEFEVKIINVAEDES